MAQSKSNVFLAVAKVLWFNGEDGEDIARDLAEAFCEIAKEGQGQNCNIIEEFIRLTAS